MISCSGPLSDCNCGTISNDGIQTLSNGEWCYWLEIKNHCSGNKKVFCFDSSTWFQNHPGDNFCVTNVDNW